MRVENEIANMRDKRGSKLQEVQTQIEKADGFILSSSIVSSSISLSITEDRNSDVKTG